VRTLPFDFTGADGQTLSGALDLPDGKVRAHALFAHCFTCSKSSLAAVHIARALAGIGVGVLRFDFTGLGRSEGDFGATTFASNLQDLIAAAAAMTAAARSPELLIGHSLGGAAVLSAAAEIAEVKAVGVIGAPFDITRVTRHIRGGVDELLRRGEAEVDIGGRPFRMRRAFVDDLERHDQKRRIHDLRRALLVLHSPHDRVVSIDSATDIFLAARHPKSFVSLDHAHHLLTEPADSLYAARVIAAWASRYVLDAAPMRSQFQCGEVVVEETGEGAFQVEVLAGGARFIADEPPEVGGFGSGPTPFDLMSAALGACTAMTMRIYARRKAWPLGKVRVRVAHAKDAGLTPADRFSRVISVAGALSAEQQAKLLHIAERCPVHRTLTGAARVTSSMGEPDAGPSDAESPIQHGLDAADVAAQASP
jgi:putative redox protein